MKGLFFRSTRESRDASFCKFFLNQMLGPVPFCITLSYVLTLHIFLDTRLKLCFMVHIRVICHKILSLLLIHDENGLILIMMIFVNPISSVEHDMV